MELLVKAAIHENNFKRNIFFLFGIFRNIILSLIVLPKFSLWLYFVWNLPTTNGGSFILTAALLVGSRDECFCLLFALPINWR